ncbi:hypothetical protein POF50_008725 [Streptomyces sp. SL13]|uniref:Uncharacterized protein n=1 Tax=Streptantibioticus silvisoli TaxID=2705255 RepID=A0AA90H274_9ACTN|nr:hypothetical protein [Streptantibioticus silvisoli]MDI5969424.1 hypothetical protein [Streptantibioticus silvisoli]
MSEHGWTSPRLSEDLELKPAPGGPVAYARTTDGPVVHLTVANEDGVVGYLWANDEDGAAGYVARMTGGDIAANSGGKWVRELRARKERGLSPSEALAELAELSGTYTTGQVVPGSRAEARDLATVRGLGQSA